VAELYRLTQFVIFEQQRERKHLKEAKIQVVALESELDIFEVDVVDERF